MQDADNVIDVTTVHRHAGVLRGTQVLHDFFNVIFEVDTNDLVARYHNVVHRHFLEVENTDQHVLVALGDHGAGFPHNGTQLFCTQVVRRGAVYVDADQFQHAVGDGVYEPYERMQQPLHGQQDAAGGKGNLLRRDGGQCLRC